MTSQSQKYVDEFLTDTNGNCKLLYLTQVGSKLYGTNNKDSDDDYKGIFVSNTDLVLLKKDIYHWTKTTGNDESKNTKDDVDFQLYSLHMFFDLLRKGETSAIELVFSVFREDTIEYIDPAFKRFIMSSWKLLVSKRLDSFFGYCLGQTKKYGIKGERLKELESIISILKSYNPDDKLSEQQFNLEATIDLNKYEFISFTKGLDGSKNEEVTYLEVLGRKFLMTNSIGYVIVRLQEVQKDYGERTKRAKDSLSNGSADKKALSHAFRIVSQVEELVQTGFLTFPRPEANVIKGLKYSDMDFEEYQSILELIGNKIDTLGVELKNSSLPDTVDEEILEHYLLQFIRNFK